MAKVILRKKAIEDLNNIWNYTVNKWSENEADIYYNTIKNVCAEIGNYPNVGKVYSEISLNLIGLKSGKHIIFYHITSENEIEVIRILHERMDLKSRLTE
jgi:toxin ParE1/3/4